MSKVSVGRPKGNAKKTSDAERIRKVFRQYGVLYPTAKVKNVLRGRNRISPEPINLNGSAINVKIAQVRGDMIEELTGVRRSLRGRFSKAERELIETKLVASSTAAEAAASTAAEAA